MSTGASFVKRTKPRSSASRISSTYSDDDIGIEASSSSNKLASVTEGAYSATYKDTSRSSTPCKTLPILDVDDEDEASASDVVFRPKARGARGTSSSSSISTSKTTSELSRASSKKERSTISMMDEDEDGDGGDAFEIRRSKLSIAGKQARRSATGLSSLSAASASTKKSSTPLRPTSFQKQDPDEAAETTSNTSSNVYTSKYLEELRTATPTSRSRAHSPAAATSFGPGTRIDDPMVAQTSYIAFNDAIDDNSLARTKFPADFSHDAIPSESVIRAAKEKRAKLRSTAASGPSSTEDFISLAPFSKLSALKAYDAMEVDDGPHPHSRLQREEDEFGDGEEEFSEYTGATERIPIGESAEKEWKERQRREMEAAVRGDFDDDMDMEEEVDEDEEEWERAQLRRTQTFPSSFSHPQSREASPFRPAPIPTSTPLPSVSTCSKRLQLTLRALEQSVAASEAVLISTSKELEKLEGAERENKLDVAAVEEKASWFSELDEFVASLARFMEEKIGRLQEAEKEALDLLVKRNKMVERKRGRWIEDRLRICLGVKPAVSVMPDFGDGQEDEERDTGTDGTIQAVVESTWRERLDPADALSFSIAQREIASTLTTIFSDVQAPEYLDPAAATSSPSGRSFLSTGSTLQMDHVDVELHPRSIVSRFEGWRRRYPEEYAQVWGGLSVSQIWEFYARLELILWDALHPPSRAQHNEGEWTMGASAIAHMHWFTAASDYAECASSSGQEVMGGDGEVLSSLVSNVLVGKLIDLAVKGVFSPWSTQQTIEAVEAVDLVQTILGATHARCTSLVEPYLTQFELQISRLESIFAQTPQIAHEETQEAVEQVVGEMADGLLKSLAKWAGVMDLSSTNEGLISALGRTYLLLLERLVGNVIEPFINSTVKAEEIVETKRKVFGIVPRHVVARSEKLTLLS